MICLYVSSLRLLNINTAKKSASKTSFSQLSTWSLKAPKTVDFNVNGACNLNCTWCWGPDHKAKEELSKEQWKDIALKLKKLGTEKITFTGGEPLMKEGLSDILRYAHDDVGLRTTLSTNAILLRRHAKTTLPYVDDIGLPLDGHNRDFNNIMRAGTPKHFDRVLEAIRMVQTEYARIDITVRTVLSSKNAESVSLIGSTMIEHGIDPQRIRWKVYELTPLGVRKSDVLGGDWLLGEGQFEVMVEKIKIANPQFPNIEILRSKSHVGRYFHIYPDGKCHVFVPGRDGLPVSLPMGNIGKDFERVIENLSEFDLSKNDIR